MSDMNQRHARRSGRRAAAQRPTTPATAIGVTVGVLATIVCAWLVLGGSADRRSRSGSERRSAATVRSREPDRPERQPGASAGYLDRMRGLASEGPKIEPVKRAQPTQTSELPGDAPTAPDEAPAAAARTAVTEPRRDESDAEAERREALFARLDKERARDVEARKKAGDDDVRGARIIAASPTPPAPAGTPSEAPPGTFRVVTLEISGGVPGSPMDKYTWGRLAYFFQQELAVPCVLVLPNGSIAPTMLYSGVRGKPGTHGPKKPPPPRRRPLVTGKVGRPDFTIRLAVNAGGSGGITFYGQQLGSNALCTIRAAVVDRRGEEPRLVDTFSVAEKVTQLTGRGAPQDPNSGLQHAYQLTLDQLMDKLRSMAVFK